MGLMVQGKKGELLFFWIFFWIFFLEIFFFFFVLLKTKGGGSLLLLFSFTLSVSVFSVSVSVSVSVCVCVCVGGALLFLDVTEQGHARPVFHVFPSDASLRVRFRLFAG